jgi:hypothetical protein
VITSDEETGDGRLIAGSPFGVCRAAKRRIAFSTGASRQRQRVVADVPMAALRGSIRRKDKVDRGTRRHPTSPTPSKRLVRRPARCEPAPRVSRAGLYRAPRQRKAHHEPPEDGGHHNASLFPQERANGDNLGQAVVRASPQSNVGVGPSQRRRNMKIASTLSVAFLAGLSVATWTSLASAQQPPGWAAAAAQCRAQVGSQYPTAEESEGMRSERARAYQACRSASGARP